MGEDIDLDLFRGNGSLLKDVIGRNVELRKHGADWVGLCPFHAEQTPSFSVYNDGHYHCYGCEAHGTIFDWYMRREGLDFSHAKERVLAEAGATTQKPNGKANGTSHATSSDIASVYDYRDENGTVVQAVRTISGKPRFWQRHPNGQGGWSPGGIENPPLYREPALRAAPPGALVWLCEGEKDVERLTDEGLIATTNISGASNWKPQYAKVLKGLRVVVLEDNDEAGRKRSAKILTSLNGIAAAAKVLRLPDLGPGEDVSDWLDKGGTREELERLGWLPAPRKAILTLEDLEALQDPDWLIAGLIPAGSLVVPYGPPKAGKSFIVLSAGLHVAAGKPWFGRAVKRGVVVYIAGEGVGGLKHRVRAMRDAYGTGSRVPFWIIPRAVNFRVESEVCALRDLIVTSVTNSEFQNVPLALVIVDTLARAMPGGDENSAQDVGLVVSWADWLRSELDCALALIHHEGKDEGRGARGTSALRGAWDAAFRITGSGRNSEMEIVDQKDAESGGILQFEMREVPTGDGRSSLVPWMIEGDGASATARRRPKKQAGLILEILGSLIAGPEAALMPPLSGLPPNTRGIEIERFRAAVYLRLGANNQATKRQAFNRAFNYLQEQKWISSIEPYVWLVQA